MLLLSKASTNSANEEENLQLDFSKVELASLIADLQKGASKKVNLTDADPQQMLTQIKKHFKIILAAGGFVYTDQDKALLIYRRGKWDLPKGKLDEGETLEACALREVEEETGLQHIALKTPLTVTYHTYVENEVPVLKESHWYLMHVNNPNELHPQTEEDIEKCEWVDFSNLSSYMPQAHLSIRDVTREAMQLKNFKVDL